VHRAGASHETTISHSDDRPETYKRCIGLTVLAHPNPARIGDFVPLFDEDRAGAIELNRLTPDLRDTSGVVTGPLDTPHLSRRSVHIAHRDGFITLRADSVAVEVNGRPLHGELTCNMSNELGGVAVLLGRHVAVWIGHQEIVPRPPALPGLIGESTAMRLLRADIHRAAEAQVPVLLRGETGVGKEIVAHALHTRSPRAAGPYVAVNMAGIPPTMAAAELFGHKRGAFTGAIEDREGYFVRANQGTLFLDEIGDTPPSAQALLLRAIEHRVIQPIGGNVRNVDVRLVAATESDLETAVADGTFRQSLLRRFPFTLRLPPLRARRDDIGLLFFHLVREQLRERGDAQGLAPLSASDPPWVPASLVARLAIYHWPGNVRELANIAYQFAARNHGRERGFFGSEIESLLGTQPQPYEVDGGRRGSEPPGRPNDTGFSAAERESAVHPTEERIQQVLAGVDYSVERAASVLGVSRSYLYNRVSESKVVQRATDLTVEQIQPALEAHAGDVKAAARFLRVSERALRLQMKRLKMER
jgi:two-component system nitrogen regulation response regulator GlnG